MGEHNTREKNIPILGNAGDDVFSYHLVLFSAADEMYELWLPKIAEGFFRFTENPEHLFLSFSKRDDQWIAVCKRPAFFRDVPLEHSFDIPLADGQLLKIETEDNTFFLYVEKVAKERMSFRNHPVFSDVEISIGRQPGNDICYDNPYTSRKHAVLHRSHGRWTIRDCGSTYGVYINGTRRDIASLKLGDVIFIMGLRIIIGPNFLSVTDGSGKVTISRRILQDQMTSHSSYFRYYGEEISAVAEQYFNRSPRKRLQVAPQTITVEGPPMSMDQTRMPLLLRMGSSMVMGGAAALAGNFLTLLSSVLFPMLSSKYSENQRKEYEQLRVTKYTEYLEMKRLEIAEACREESNVLNQMYPELSQITTQAMNQQRLWERRPVDHDFLCVRLGTGSQRLSAVIDYPARRFELVPDELEEKMYQLAETPYYLENTPVVLSLVDTNVCGLLGPRNQVIAFLHQIILQLAFFHSYDEVKLVFLLRNEELALMDFLRYLPHVWDDQRAIRFIATNEAEVYDLGEFIKGQITEDKNAEKDLQQILKTRPYYLIFALDKKLFEGHEVLKDILQDDKNHGVSIIAAYDDLPKESRRIITLETEQKNICTTMDANGGEDTFFALDLCEPREIAETMRMLANTSLKAVAQTQSIPKMITFLEMFKTGRIEQLNPLKRWHENNPVTSLATPVGVGADGSLFMLDLHEKRQGPHGLVAGMTGSGKSEFIITYILSMAVNYHPDEVAFVLIDYKGGGLAGAFENPKTGVRLPHLVGTITNLDGPSIQRSLMSIESELIRRQKIFNEIKSVVNEGTMDIYAYQKLYRAGKVSKPMPHLFIISDEFAELKQQQPEFMDKLISAARIGRSLGVHLILATQKPTGVVNDQIRSNTKFRVCLRVQERSDSMDMLKRPEAAELTDTGRFYLQVGYNEYFAMGQSAWCGAAYEPQDVVAVHKDETIEFLDTTGQTVAKAKPKIRKTNSGMKQIVAIVKYLSDLASAQGIQTRQLCKPELPKTLDLDELQKEDGTDADNAMSVCLGRLDDPENQRQFPLKVDFETCQNMLIAGDSGSGKTALVQNILYLLAKQLSPQDFNFYILDYSSRMMKLFKPLPHCGAVLQEEDIGSLDEFFKLINSVITERKRLFSELEVDSFDAARKIKKLPLILVVIDNIAGLSGSKIGEAHSYKLQNYFKNSANYGIKYIVTCSHLNEVSSKVRRELVERICLHMQDKYDYSEMLGCKVSYLPPEYPGRGLVKCEERPLEFHSAIILAGADDHTRTRHIKEAVGVLCKRYGARLEAQRLAVIKDDVEYEEFAAQFRRGRIPLGYSKSTHKPVALPLKQLSVLSLYFGDARGTVPILNNILYAAEREQMELWVIKRCEKSLFDAGSEDGVHFGQLSNADYLPCSVDNLRLLQQALVGMMTQRQEILDNYYAERGIDAQQEGNAELSDSVLREKTAPIMLVIESVADFCRTLNALSTLSYCNLFKKLQKYNIFVVGCFEPGTPKEVSCNSLYTYFSKNDMLLFGGQFDQQSLYVVSGGSMVEKVPFNAALMIYRREAYALVMPCGIVEEKKTDEDLLSIF